MKELLPLSMAAFGLQACLSLEATTPQAQLPEPLIEELDQPVLFVEDGEVQKPASAVPS